MPQIIPSRFGKWAKSPSETSIASETASPSSFFIVPQTCSVLPVCVPKYRPIDAVGASVGDTSCAVSSSCACGPAINFTY